MVLTINKIQFLARFTVTNHRSRKRSPNKEHLHRSKQWALFMSESWGRVSGGWRTGVYGHILHLFCDPLVFFSGLQFHPKSANMDHCSISDSLK